MATPSRQLRPFRTSVSAESQQPLFETAIQNPSLFSTPSPPNRELKKRRSKGGQLQSQQSSSSSSASSSVSDTPLSPSLFEESNEESGSSEIQSNNVIDLTTPEHFVAHNFARATSVNTNSNSNSAIIRPRMVLEEDQEEDLFLGRPPTNSISPQIWEEEEEVFATFQGESSSSEDEHYWRMEAPRVQITNTTRVVIDIDDNEDDPEVQTIPFSRNTSTERRSEDNSASSSSSSSSSNSSDRDSIESDFLSFFDFPSSYRSTNSTAQPLLAIEVDDQSDDIAIEDLDAARIRQLEDDEALARRLEAEEQDALRQQRHLQQQAIRSRYLQDNRQRSVYAQHFHQRQNQQHVNHTDALSHYIQQLLFDILPARFTGGGLPLLSFMDRDFTEADYEMLLRLDENTKKKTLDSNALNQIPVRKYIKPQSGKGKGAASTNQEEDLTCVICMVDIEDGDEIRQLPCKHEHFHKDCIDKWLKECNSTCPICKANIQDLTSKQGQVNSNNTARKPSDSSNRTDSHSHHLHHASRSGISSSSASHHPTHNVNTSHSSQRSRRRPQPSSSHNEESQRKRSRR